MDFWSSSSPWTVYVYVYVYVVVFRCCRGDLQVTACPGQDVPLPCSSPPGKVIVLEWVKPELDSRLYVYFLRQNRRVESFLHPSFKNRTALSDDGSDGNMTVILRNVTVNDTGTYECRVAVDTARSRQPVRQNVVSLKVEDACRRPDYRFPFLEQTWTRHYLFTWLALGLLLLLIIISCFIFYKCRHSSPRTDKHLHDAPTI